MCVHTSSGAIVLAGASHARVLCSVRGVMREHGIADVTVQLEVEGDCDLLAGDCDDASSWHDEHSSEYISQVPRGETLD